MRIFVKNFVKISDCRAFTLFYGEKESDHEGTRTLNLPIRSRTPYPLGHAASHRKAKIFNALHFGEIKTISVKYLC